MCWLWSVTLTLLLMNQIQRFRSQSEAPRETVTCRSDDMFLIIHKRGLQSSPRLYVQDRHGNYLSMRDHARQCLYDLLETPGFLILRVSHSSCHVHRRVRGGSITFWVNIVVEKASRSKQASVFREAPFRNFYEDQLHPTMHTLGEPVFVEIFVLKREDKDLVLLLHDCWATPSADPQDERRWDLLREGCPQRRADYSVEVLEVQPGDGVKFPDLHKWLKIKMFSFVEREDAFESVYLHCDIEVCKGAPCRRTCNRKKRQSTVQWDLKERLVLQRDAVCGGPLLLTR
ncbi:zona pellucida sperm-binding protein 4-like isoform X2 [Pygocentrus nattereri]|uniref:zona pellucida sperm-binding protein 4-like isoform X2 n=1 Tax=Pygocentrus nattereri TaxID=42514 RepID=UPI0008145F85|nr:zona pellucida sperm-binding protein 4-like isoform X2 [Pygocentrus nattereri]